MRENTDSLHYQATYSNLPKITMDAKLSSYCPIRRNRKLALGLSANRVNERSRWRDGRFACYCPGRHAERSRFELRFSLSSDFSKPRKINRLQTKKDSIPIAMRTAPAISLRPPQTQAASFKRVYRTCARALRHRSLPARMRASD